MALREEFRNQGNWLFRRRSYLPLLLLVVVFLGMKDFRYPGNREDLDKIWEMVCLLISFSGVGLRFVTVGFTPKGTSGTNTRGQVADSLNTTGMYSVVRHPLYLGNFIIWFGLSAYFRLWWFSLIVVLAFWLYYERIMYAEEEYLREKFGASFLDWAAGCPAFVPDLRKWHSADLVFSVRKAIGNEYKSLFAVVVAFSVLEILGDIFVTRKVQVDRLWLSVFAAALLMFVTVRFLRKRTRIFEVHGRSG